MVDTVTVADMVATDTDMVVTVADTEADTVDTDTVDTDEADMVDTEMATAIKW